MADPFTASVALKVGAGLFSGIGKYQEGKAQAKSIMAQGRADAANVLEQGRIAVENQNLIGSALGYSLNPETSNFRVLVETEKEARRQADIILANARKAAKDAKKSGKFGAIGSTLGGIASVFEN
jgi:vacuolar-type H+-ATPase subunit H